MPPRAANDEWANARAQSASRLHSPRPACGERQGEGCRLAVRECRRQRRCPHRRPQGEGHREGPCACPLRTATEVAAPWSMVPPPGPRIRAPFGPNDLQRRASAFCSGTPPRSAGRMGKHCRFDEPAGRWAARTHRSGGAPTAVRREKSIERGHALARCARRLKSPLRGAWCRRRARAFARRLVRTTCNAGHRHFVAERLRVPPGAWGSTVGSTNRRAVGPRERTGAAVPPPPPAGRKLLEEPMRLRAAHGD